MIDTEQARSLSLPLPLPRFSLLPASKQAFYLSYWRKRVLLLQCSGFGDFFCCLLLLLPVRHRGLGRQHSRRAAKVSEGSIALAEHAPMFIDLVSGLLHVGIAETRLD